jgi:hypothetical protein
MATDCQETGEHYEDHRQDSHVHGGGLPESQLCLDSWTERCRARPGRLQLDAKLRESTGPGARV